MGVGKTISLIASYRVEIVKNRKSGKVKSLEG
jgi:hypothetical protein